MLSKSVRLAAAVSCWSPCPPSCRSLCPPCLPSVSFCLPSCGHCVRLVSLHSFFVSGLVFFLVGHCVRLVSLLSPFVSLLVSRLVDHCVRLVSLLLSFVSFLSPSCWSLCPPRPFCLPLTPVLSPFLWITVRLVSLLFCFCFPSCLPSCWSSCPHCCFCLSPVLSPSLLVTVSILSPFCFLLSPLLVSLVVSCWSLRPPCLPSERLCLAILCLPALDVASSSCRVFRL